MATSFDIGIRGMLIDPYEHEDALLYIAYRRLKRGNNFDIREGDKSSSKVMNTTQKYMIWNMIH